MAKSKRTAAPKKVARRSRGEIDRNYYFGDVLIKTGVAVVIVLALIAIATPFTLRDAVQDGMWGYLSVMGGFAFLGLGAYLAGRHLRHEATHWDFD